jgi:hypothetical protein
VGTTTICGLLDRPALVGWAGKTCTQEAWEAGKAGQPMPRWNDVLYGKRDDAAAAGTLVHDLFEAHLRQLPLPPVPDDDIGKAARRGFANALAWLGSSGLVVESHERPLVSRRYRYGGTPDAVGRDSAGRHLLLDWKTSKGVYASMIIQMAAYRQLLAECEGVTVAGVHLVRFSREYGDFAHYYFEDDALDLGWSIFEALLAVYSPLKELERRVK